MNVLPEGYVVPSKQAEASWALVGGNTIAENYAFVGVHHIFDQVSTFLVISYSKMYLVLNVIKLKII